MALGKNCTSKARPCCGGGLRRTTSKGLDFGNCTSTTTSTLGGKRVVVSNYYMEELSSSSSTSTPSPLKTPSKKKRIGTRLNSERDDDDDLSSSSTLGGSPFETPTKKNRFGSRLLDLERPSSLEALPQDILVRLLCCVDHDDLKQLFHVSPIVREATLIAKDWHFAFSTPSSKTAAMRFLGGDLEDPNQFDMATPNAPKRCGSYRPSRISREKLNDISVALFHSPGEELWEKKKNCGLFMQKTEVGYKLCE